MLTVSERAGTPPVEVRKTKRMLEVEAQHGGRDIRDILATAYTTHQQIQRAAASLGIPWPTFADWMHRLGIETRRMAQVRR